MSHSPCLRRRSLIKVKTTGGYMSSPLISSSSLHSREGGRGGRKGSPRPANDNADPCVFILRTRVKRFNRETVRGRGRGWETAGSVNEEGMKILN